MGLTTRLRRVVENSVGHRKIRASLETDPDTFDPCDVEDIRAMFLFTWHLHWGSDVLAFGRHKLL